MSILSVKKAEVHLLRSLIEKEVIICKELVGDDQELITDIVNYENILKKLSAQ